MHGGNARRSRGDRLGGRARDGAVDRAGAARAGADVVLGARREESLQAVAAEVEALGRRAVCVVTDITEPEQCRRLADAAASDLGRLDVLVNNAFTEEDWHDPFDGFDPDRWRRPIDVNLFGTLNSDAGVRCRTSRPRAAARS